MADGMESPLEQRLISMAKGGEPPVGTERLYDAAFWDEIGSQHGLHCTGTADPAAPPPPHPELADSLEKLGYSRAEVGLPGAVEGLRGAMRELRKRGFAPVWIWAFDEAWLLLQQAARAAAPALRGAEALVEPTVFAYAVAAADEKDPREERAEATGSSRQAYPGGNFGLPHRDHLYDECFGSDGLTTVSLWHALTDVTCDSGCMFVVPRPSDSLFDNPQHPLHSMPYDYAMESAPTFSLADAVALPCSAGTVLMWCGNTVHWGGRHQAGSGAEPRVSLTSTIRLAGGKPTRLQEQTGLSALRIDELREVPLQRRVRHIACSLLLYRWWYGLDSHHGVWPQQFDGGAS
eukprot:TRINITY_DN7103_c1_g1_i1.p1 TRINITY_DN7103_c1_g1~~TRINITY_DN7103_c1_g1_i1.p1  ORF type:complete len:348 (+),score=105.41 TRINITY_DN7103_c1_g1_i1:54-1097(+)